MDHSLSFFSSCVRRGLCYRRQSLWVLLLLLVVCLAIQTFVARQASDRPTRLPLLRFTVNKQQLFPTIIPGDDDAEFSLQVQQDVRSEPTGSSLNRHPENAGRAESSDNILWTSDSGSDTKEGKVPSQKFLSEKQRNNAAAGLTTDETLIRPRNKRPANTSTLLSFINNANSETTCRPKSHIVFLKTHKTASSTILNILYRYGERRNLTFALPLDKHSQLFYPFFFASHFVEGFSSRRVKEFNIMCNHMRFKKYEVAKVMPGDSFYFSVLRNPVAMMESIFTYYKSIQAFHKTNSLDDFLKTSWRNYNSSVTNNHYAHNILAFDFGFDNNVAADAADFEDRVSRVIAAIERDFHLILISEYFDESMILLKHALCWSLEDVASFKLNSRSERTRRRLSSDTVEEIKKWNALDWRIYQHFNNTFWYKVNSLVGDQQMTREVSQLRELQDELANTCLKDGRAVEPSQIKDAALKPFQYGAAVIQGYNLNPHIDQQTRARCERLITPELQYTERLYTQQFPELAAKQRRATRKIPSRHQRSNRSEIMGLALAKEAFQKLFVRRKFFNLKNQEVSKGSPPAAENRRRI